MTEHDDIEEPKKSAEWLTWIEEGKKYFNSYFAACSSIDRIYANLNDLRDAASGTEFGLLWANEQIQRPSIYARPPVPAVTPRFQDRRPLYRTASEMLERVAHTQFDLSDIDSLMLALRDDLSLTGRGVAWVRRDDDGICLDHVDREDFLCDGVRSWKAVNRVARRGWLTFGDMKERFGVDVATSVNYAVQDRSNQNLTPDERETCGVWEIWDKPTKTVVWVVEGVEDVLDHGDPPFDVEGFFPCPKPAFGTLQPKTIIPVPDFLHYRQQNDDVQVLTRRISALMNALQMKGFYPASGEIGDAIEAAYNVNDDGRVMVPVSSMAAFGTGGDVIVWLPIDQVAATLTACVELRRQLIDDVYQVTGISDIMRGATEAQETLGAQELKQQNGSIRVRDKQNELVRVARDICRIVTEIIAEEYPLKKLEEMSQLELPHKAEIKAQIKDLEAQGKAMAADLQRLQSDPNLQAQIQQNPEAAQQAIEQFEGQMGQIQEQIAKLGKAVTWEDVYEFVRDNKLRPFVLDIETDSTIYPDEQAEKAARSELLGVVMGVLPAAAQLAALGPQAVALAGGLIKFSVAPYRVGRELDGLINDFVESAPQMAEAMQAAQGQGEDMAALAEAEMQKAKAQMAKVEADTALKQAEMQLTQAKMQAEFQEKSAKLQLENDKLQLESAKAGNEAQLKLAEMEAKINHLQAQTAKLLSDIGLDVRKQDLEEYRTATDTAMRETEMVANEQHRSEDMAVAERDKVVDREFRAKEMEANQRGNE